ncbi:MAG: ABC transporter substrate-binding protein [Candidatus Omnitrophica bacterium]|nr:ABC transporter substrate-binding protein [Candidatus Omnitrophota bacterium]
MKNKICFILIAISLLAFCLPGSCSDFPQRIISLGPAITKQLYLLGAEQRLIGVTTYCRYPAQAKEKEKVGTVLDINLEKIMQLQPDLVLATSLTNQKDIRKLRSLGVRTVAFGRAKSFAEICEHFLTLGRYLGKEKEAATIINQAQVRVKIIKEKVREKEQLKVFIQVGAKPLITVSRDSFFNDLIEFAGGINVAGDALSGLYSREKVVKDNPDAIIITTMGITGDAEKTTWESFSSINAVKSGRIYIVDEYQYCSTSPLDFVQALVQMVQMLHPNDA